MSVFKRTLPTALSSLVPLAAVVATPDSYGRVSDDATE